MSDPTRPPVEGSDLDPEFEHEATDRRRMADRARLLTVRLEVIDPAMSKEAREIADYLDREAE